MSPEEFSQKIKARYPQYKSLDDLTLARKVIEKYPQYGSQVKMRDTRFVETPMNRENKLATYKAEAAQAQAEAQKAGSFMGMAKNFGKAFISNIAGSEVGLGKTIAKTMGNQADVYSKAIEDTTTQQVNLLKQIREKKARNEDVTKLEGLYNEGEMQLRHLNENLAEETSLPTTGKVYGQLGGTALDVLTAGTYGKATQAMQKGKLASKTAPVVATTVANHLTSSKQILENLPVEQIAKNGGVPAVLQRAQTNIVDQLTKQGMKNAASQVAKINPALYSTVDDFAKAIQVALPSSASTIAQTLTTPFAPELAKVGSIAAQKSGGLLSKQGATAVAKGAGIGYGYDVSQGLQGARGEDREGGAALIPGMGTAIGGAIPLITGGIQTIKNATDPEIKANKLIQARKQELDKLDRLTTLSKQVEKGNQRGIDIKNVLAQTDVLNGAVDNTGKITTRGEDGAIARYTNEFIAGNEDLVSKALKKEGVSIAPKIIEKRLKDAISNSGIQGAELVQAENKLKRELAGYARRANTNGSIPISIVHDAKIDKYSNINFMADPAKQKYDKAIAEALKEIVEDYTKEVSVKEINKELSKHYAVLGYLEKLDGKIVEGGKLGKYFAQTVGAVVGSHFGPVGAVVGAEAGGRIKGNIMSRTFKGATGKVQPQAGVVTKAKEYLAKEPLRLK